MIRLYTWTTPNGRKASIALEELGLSYEVVPVNLGQNEQLKPGFLKLNPNHKIPVLDDTRRKNKHQSDRYSLGESLLFNGGSSSRCIPS